VETYWLCFTLLSDATFGRGEGVAGLVDQEVDHDRYGLPYLRGRTLKGLLNEECANILYALNVQGVDLARWHAAAQRLFGGPGSTMDRDAKLRIGAARLPADLRRAVRQALQGQDATLSAVDVLDALTDIRHQTAVDEETGAPDAHTLRAMRVVLRQTAFEARLTFPRGSAQDDLPLLAACVLALRRAGTGRNRGRGHLKAFLHADQAHRPGADITPDYFNAFAQEVRP
jgi:hypothetical protein